MNTREGATNPPELSMLTRRANLDRMSREEFDIVVIGGGITGAGVALDAAARGLRVALVEKRDFASGTSSRSSKLIHGGLRYLARMQLGLVRESLLERAVLQRVAPHLARKLPFVVPIYEPPARSPLGSNKLKLSIGLTIYDLLAGRENLGRHFWLEGAQGIAFAAGLELQGLRGCFIYYDGLTDDSRLVIEVIKEAAAQGALVANYAAAVSVLKNGGNVSGLAIEDSIGKNSLEVRAKVIVNATGVWSDEVVRMLDHSAKRTLRPSKGIHIVVPHERVPVTSAVLVPSYGEDRFLFVIPWHGRTLIGTTDADYDGTLDEPEPDEGEIARVVESTNSCFTRSGLVRSDVIAAFAGLRPLVSDNGHPTKDLSRKERILETYPRIISVIGGKLTTYRRIAERVVDRVCRILGKAAESRTANIVLAGGSIPHLDSLEVIRQKADAYSVEADVVSHLMRSYGARYESILQISRESADLKKRVVQGLLNIEAEFIYALRYEMATNVDDLLARRTRISLLAGKDAPAPDRIAAMIDLVERPEYR